MPGALIHLGPLLEPNSDGYIKVARAMKSAVSGEFFNVSSGRETTLKELADTLIKVSGKTDIKPNYVPRDKNLVSRRFGSAAKAKEMLGFEVSTPLAEGLQHILTWREEVKKRNK